MPAPSDFFTTGRSLARALAFAALLVSIGLNLPASVFNVFAIWTILLAMWAVFQPTRGSRRAA